MQWLDVKPLVGIGPVTFGMSPPEVIAHLGTGQVWEAWMGGNLNDSLVYHGLVLIFDRCDAYGPLEDSRLEYIDVKQREDVRLYGKAANDWTRPDLLRYLEQNAIEFAVLSDGAVSFPQLCFEVGFDSNAHADFLCMWQPGGYPGV